MNDDPRLTVHTSVQIEKISGKAGGMTVKYKDADGKAHSTKVDYVIMGTGKRPVLDDMVDHIAYVADLVGTAHVGIGSDFFEAESPVRMERFFRVRYPAMIRGYDLDTVYMDEFRRVEHLPRLTRRLLERGFSAEEVSGILGGNFQRVFAEVWT